MNKLWTVFLVFLAIIIWQVAGPYYTIYQIKQAVEQQDAVKLAKYVNFIQLKQNLKTQLQAKLKRRLEQQNGSFFGMLAITTTEKALDNVLDRSVNPETILLYMKGKRPLERKLNAIGGWSHDQESAESMNVSVVQDHISQNKMPQTATLHTSVSGASPVQILSDDSVQSEKPNAIKNWTARFDDISNFSVVQQRASGTKIRYLLTRSGSGWQLSNIMLPMH